MQKNKILILISGMASGKSSVINELTKKHGFKEFKYFTTRTKRNELDDDYHFVSDERFYEMVEADKFVEHRKYFVNVNTDEGVKKALWKYGTAKTIKTDNTFQVMQMPIDGALSVYEYLNEQAILIYLECDENIKRKRALKRGDLIEEIERRISNDKKYIKQSEQNCHIIINTDRKLDEIVADVLDCFNYYN
jgi:guanylate kinase